MATLSVLLPLFLSAATATVASTDELLPATPEDWRYERLELPLSFAPELDYEGFEELRFAPGMFDGASDTYFTYAFAIRLESLKASERVDAGFLERFLTTYYRGLCRSVGGERELDMDLSKVAVKARKAEDGGFTLVADLFDAFGTGEELRLELDLVVHRRNGATDLFAVASPAARTSDVWTTLGGFVQEWKAARAPVLLHHLYMIPDRATFDALHASTFLRESFCVFEERETVRPDLTYKGIYFYGEHTYFEFLPPRPGRFQVGQTGIAFGTEVPGSTKALGARFEAQGVTTFPASARRDLDGAFVPWFELMGVQIPREDALFNFYSLEYDPTFLERWHGDLPPAGGGITREAVLQRYAAQLGAGERAKELPFIDVVGVEVALTDEVRERFFAACETFGYTRQETEEGWVVGGPDVEITVLPSDAPGGIRAFTMSLRRPLQEPVMVFGRARLIAEGNSATLRFAD